MLPTTLTVTTANSLQTRLPTYTYRLNLLDKRIYGFTDKIDAMVQALNKIAETERFAWIIYSAHYGIELESLLGQSMVFVEAVIEQRIREAFLADDRVVSIENFSTERQDTESLIVSCRVHTIHGEIDFSKELTLQ